ncbi:MAG: hypothetical protein M5U09_13405 [Gammaproteobacteria bacterium]|nr:hypothetical protein [Gammaproteobacteria bacterium]
MTSRMTFGWAALVDERPRRVATASCLEPTVLLAIDGRRLLEILEQDTASGFTVMRRLGVDDRRGTSRSSSPRVYRRRPAGRRLAAIRVT